VTELKQANTNELSSMICSVESTEGNWRVHCQVSDRKGWG